MLELAGIFRDNMVLQRGKPIHIRGFSDCSQSLSYYINDKVIAQGLAADGNFSHTLPEQNAAENVKLLVRGENDFLELKNVDIGEVWIAGGQSNMEFSLSLDISAGNEIKSARDHHIRFYDVGKYAFEGEEDEGLVKNRGWNRWLPFTPENARDFSAVGVYFAKILRKRLNVPVAVIGCNWGGTSASAWLDEAYLEKTPELAVYLDEYREMTANIDLDKYEKERKDARKLLADPSFVRLATDSSHGIINLWDKLRMRRVSPESIMRAVTLVGPKSFNRPGGLFDSMVKKAAGYTSRGVIWYQGESDCMKPDIYHILFSSVIKCWREQWKDELPFLFVQLAPFGSLRELSGENFPIIREKQEWVGRNMENAYMASIMDAGMENDIHPRNKRPVGERLALLAMGKIYGEDILCEAPELVGAKVQEGGLILTFDYAGEGLYVKGERINSLRLFAEGTEVEDFSFSLTENTVDIRQESITCDKKIEILYAYEPYCEVNLYNSADIPAKPFRWPDRAEN